VDSKYVSGMQAAFWQTIGYHEYEVAHRIGYTGRYRCVGGRLADGTWPIFGEYRFGPMSPFAPGGTSTITDPHR
jgi:hypothetical protein